MSEISTVASSVAPPPAPQQPGGAHAVAAIRKDQDIGTGEPETWSGHGGHQPAAHGRGRVLDIEV